MILANHGLLVAGRTIPEAFNNIYYLERACQAQVAAMAGGAELILMDEPFGALDPITRRGLQAEFRDLQRRLGKTVVLVTHDLREAAVVADRLALMDGGRLVQQGVTRDFLDHPATPFVREFFREAEAVA